jgi:hypothetical protein
MEKTKCPGFIIDLKKPFKPGFVTCMVITPHYQDGTPGVDVSKKLERDMRRKKASSLPRNCWSSPTPRRN